MEILASIIGPVATATIEVVGGAVAYGHQRTVDRKISILKKHQEIYCEVLKSIMEIAFDQSSTNAQKKYKLIRSELALYGSDSVVEQMREFSDIIERDNVPNIQTEGKDRGSVILKGRGELVAAMRSDVIPGGSLEGEELSKLSPFK